MCVISALRLITFSALIIFGNGHRVLLVFPFPGVSHSILGEAMVRPLLEDGHEVTYITSVPIKEQFSNLTQVDVSSLFHLLNNLQLRLDMFVNTDYDGKDYSFVLPMMQNITIESLKHENVQKLIHDTDNKFDVVVAEWMYSELYSGFAAVFNCPYIWSSSMDPHWLVLRLIDEAPSPAYVSDNFSEAVPPLSFFERIKELWTIIKVHYIWLTKTNPLDETSYNEVFKSAVEKRGRKLPPLNIMRHNASIMLGNSHASTGMPIRLPQSYKPIGGYHIPDKVDPLPGDLQRTMDNAKHGVIYFSMGSVLKSKDLPDKLRDELIKMFGTLKQTVIWKFEADIDNLPKNIHITKWAPQKSILAHHNTKLFITHGGLLSTTEAVCYGVPIIGIPGFADQALNVNRAIAKGFALRVNLNYDLQKNLKRAIEESLNNPKYKNTVNHLSKIYHARPVSPRRELQHWTRLVAESKGEVLLRSVALPLPWYEKSYLDLAAVVIIAFITIVLIVTKLNVNVSSKKDKFA